MGKTKEIRNQTKKISKTPQILQSRRSLDNLIEEEMEFIFKKKKIGKAVKREWESSSLLSKAVYAGSDKVVDELLERGDDVNVQTEDGNSPLMIAVERGDTEIIRKLLQNGADIKLANKHGMNPLMVAISKNDNHMFRVLWEYADVNAKNLLNQESVGATVLCLAFKQERLDVDVIRLLLSKLSFEDRDLYVKRRIELLETPRPKTYQEMVKFYKEILFRVMYQIKRIFQDGLELLHKYQFFFGLMKCAQSHQWDTDLLRLSFHLSACIMYEDAALPRDLVEQIAEQYVSAKGPHFSLRIMLSKLAKEMPDVRGAAFLPIHACANCTSGKHWLTENYAEVHRFVEDFRTLRCTLKYWVKDESERAAIVFHKFENIMIEVGAESQCLKSAFPKPKVEKDSSPSKSVRRHSSDDQKSMLPVKMKLSGVKTSPKNITFYSKLSPRTEKILRYGTLRNASSSGDILHHQTGYADALKKNMSFQSKTLFFRNHERFHTQDLRSNFSTDAENKTGTKCPSQNSSFESYLDDDHKIPKNLSKEMNKRKSLEKICRENHAIATLTLCDKKLSVVGDEKDNSNHLIAKATRYIPVSTMFFLANRYHTNVSMGTPVSKKESSPENFNHQCVLCESKNTDSLIKVLDSPQKVRKNDIEVLEKSGEDEAECEKVEKSTPNSNFEVRNSPNAEELATVSHNGTRLKSKSKKMSVLELLERARMMSAGSQKHQKEDCTQTSTVSSGAARSRTYSEVAKGDNEPKSVSSKNNVMRFAENFRNWVSSAVVKTRSPSIKVVEEVDGFSGSGPTRTSCEITHEESKTGCIDNLSSTKKTNTNGDENTFDCCPTSNLEDKIVEKNCELSDVNTKFEEIVNSDDNLNDVNNEKNYSSDTFSVKSDSEVTRTTLDESQFANYAKKQDAKTDEKTNSVVKANLCIECFFNKNACKRNELIITGSNDNARQLSTEIKKPVHATKGAISPKPKSLPLLNKLKVKTVEAVKTRLKSAENNISPLSVSQLKLLSLRKSLSLYQRFFHNKMETTICDACSKSINFPFCREVSENSLLRLFDNEKSFPQSSKQKGYSSDKYLAKNRGRVMNKDRQMITLQADVEKLVLNEVIKNQKNALLGKRIKHVSPNPEMAVGRRRRVARDRIIGRRRGVFPEEQNTKSNFENIDDSNYFQWGYIPESVNLDKRSKWYNILKDIHSCIPLSYHLLSQTKAEKVTFHTAVIPGGNVVFSSKLEYTLREGGFGTYLGLLDVCGDPIVVREYNSSNILRKESIRALSNKRNLKHKNIVNFYGSVLVNSKVFSVAELCEFNLSQFVKEMKRFRGYIPTTVVLRLISDLLEGISYLHRMQIIHGFLKPSNVMVTMDCRLKLTDCFLLDVVPLVWGLQYQELKSQPIGTSISSCSWRPTELIAAENELEARENITFASDIQMAGMLMYYIISGGKHRFGISDSECQMNIKLGFIPPRLESIDFEAKDLMNGMMKKNKSNRLAIKSIIKHPYFWNCEFKFQFLVRVGKKLICENKDSEEIEEFRKCCSEEKRWTSFVYPWLITCMCKLTNKFYTNDPLDLLHFAVALQDNFDMIPSLYKQFILKPSLFILQVFPTFFISVYCLVRQNVLMQRQTGLQNFF